MYKVWMHCIGTTGTTTFTASVSAGQAMFAAITPFGTAVPLARAINDFDEL